MSEQYRWLLLEGITPLFGAGFFYVLWGACRYIAAVNKAAFKYHWAEALDPLGWLYGALIVAVQTATKCLSGTSIHESVAWWCIAGSVACLFLLLAAMNDRAASPGWKPPLVLQGLAVILVGAILFAGLIVHTAPVPGKDASVEGKTL
jgi:hypothetical protein